MALTIKDGKGLAFYNSKGLMKNAKAPTLKGEQIVDGVRQTVTMWINTDRNGNMYASWTTQETKAYELAEEQRIEEYYRNRSEAEESDRGTESSRTKEFVEATRDLIEDKYDEDISIHRNS